MGIKYRCSQNPDHSSNFLANNAKVIQEWLCNEDGEYIKTVTECVDVLHSPEELKLVCRECGSDAQEYEYVPDVVDILREKDWSGWSIGDQGTLCLHGKAGGMTATISDKTKESSNRIFKASIHPGTSGVESKYIKTLAQAIDWCEGKADI